MRSLPLTARIILWTLGLIPACWNCFTLISPCKLHAMQTPPRVQSLAFDQYVMDFRRMKQRPKDVYPFYFNFRNVGDKPLKITKMEPSCGCLKPNLDKKDSTIYEPGESGDILVRIQAASQTPGDKEFWVDVHYEDPEPRQRRVSLKLNLPQEQVWLEPKALVFYPGASAENLPPQEIRIKDLRADQLRVIGVSCDQKYVKLDVKYPEKGSEEAGSVIAKIMVTLEGPLPSGRSQPVIKIYTDDPAQSYHELRVPMIVSTPEITADRTLSSDAE